jgi:hypothetical protein
LVVREFVSPSFKLLLTKEEGTRKYQPTQGSKATNGRVRKYMRCNGSQATREHKARR